ncbi:MAG TPA: hypothetical protein VKZ94_06635, partial [Advenella sp.]|nr:hypothetical protein [Advenella sp.]
VLIEQPHGSGISKWRFVAAGPGRLPIPVFQKMPSGAARLPAACRARGAPHSTKRRHLQEISPLALLHTLLIGKFAYY